MFDPSCVKNYKLVHDDAVHALLYFKPGSIDCICATPGIDSYKSEYHEPWMDFYGYRAQFFQLLYDVLKPSGSLFMEARSRDNDILVNMMKSIGWKSQHDCHWTKSDDYYVNDIDEKLKFIEDQKIVEYINKSIDLSYPFIMEDLVDEKLNAICKKYVPSDGILLEPTVGNGRHLIAALINNRRFIGIDWNLKALVVCARRVSRLQVTPDC